MLAASIRYLLALFVHVATSEDVISLELFFMQIHRVWHARYYANGVDEDAAGLSIIITHVEIVGIVPTYMIRFASL